MRSGGSTAATRSILATAAGGVRSGGSTAATRSILATAAGGVRSGGSTAATRSTVYVATATGGSALGGSTRATRSILATATGGSALGGRNVLAGSTFALVATGGSALGGHVVDVVGSLFVVLATGGVALGGRATGVGVSRTILRQAVYHQLANHPALVDLVGPRIYPQGASQVGGYPHIVYSVTGRDDLANLDGLNRISVATIRVDCFDESKRVARDVSIAVEAALSPLNWFWPDLRTVAVDYDGAAAVVMSPGDPFRAVRSYAIQLAIEVCTRG